MKINGLIVASSEIIRFEKGEGIIFTFYNVVMDAFFWVLAFSNLDASKWKKVLVNRCYAFSSLKQGSIQSCCNIQRIVYKTQIQSTFEEVQHSSIESFQVPSILTDAFYFPEPKMTFQNEEKQDSYLISYQGFITGMKNFDCGIYELDKKIILYLNFNNSFTQDNFHKGSEIFVANAHFLTAFKEKILVCCGLTSVRIINRPISKEKKNENINTNSKSKKESIVELYPLSIYDLIWLENLLNRLKEKFSFIVDNGDIFFKSITVFQANIMEYFGCLSKESHCYKKLSLVDEYFSRPHHCFAFYEDCLPTASYIHDISDILKVAVENISWIEFGRNWKISAVNQVDFVLIGMLYFENGHFVITDKSCTLYVYLTNDCSDCDKEKCNFSKFMEQDKVIMVASTEFDIMFESIDCKGTVPILQKYLRTSCCRLFCLSTFSRSECFTGSESLNHTFHKLSLQEKDLKPSEKSVTKGKDSIILENDEFLNEQRVFVLSKLWHSKYNMYPMLKFLVLFLPKERNNIAVGDGKDFIEDSFNFYDTEDDSDFDDLVTQIEELSLENRLRFGHLHFSDCKYMLPLHLYILSFKDRNSVTDALIQKNVQGVLKLEVTEKIHLQHSPICKIQKDLNINYVGVKDIVSTRLVPHDSIVIATLIEKFYENGNINSNKSNKPAVSTACLILKDVEFEDVIYAYVPTSHHGLVGFLPGVELQLYGFICSCSHRGFLYLKTSSEYGIEVTSCERKSLNGRISAGLDGNYFEKTYRSICFVHKIISAEFLLVCGKCGRQHHESCSCISLYKVDLKVSALIDDGKQVFLARCSGETGRQILMLDKKIYCKFSQYIHQTQTKITFSEKMISTETKYLPFLGQAFFCYCSSKAVCRQVFLEYIKLPNLKRTKDTYSEVWCKKIIDWNTKEIFNEFYHDIKHS